ncbi:MAG: DMT family transporter [Bdellovibrionota bacterium]
MPIILALSACLVFSYATSLFADFSRAVSGKWINCFKLTVASFFFLLIGLFMRDGMIRSTIPLFMVSGALGLFLADHFLCEAFGKIGSARTLLIFSFAPFFVACWSYLFFGEKLSPQKLIAICFFVACVITLSLEKLKIEGRWEITGLVLAFSGVLLDGLANVITSYGFRVAPENGVFSVCALRAAGAFIAFLLLNPFLKVKLIENFNKLNSHKKRLAIVASFLGAFLSLTLWISAVKRGNLTTLVSLSGITPVFAAIFEVARGKTKFSKYLGLAFVFYFIGFYYLVIKA